MAIFTCEWRQFTPHLFAATHALEAEARKTKYPVSSFFLTADVQWV